MVQVVLLDAELNWAHLVDVLVRNGLLSVWILGIGQLHLRAEEVLPDAVAEVVQPVVLEDGRPVRVHETLLAHDVLLLPTNEALLRLYCLRLLHRLRVRLLLLSASE